MTITEAAQALEKEFKVKMIELIGENEDKYVFLSEDYRDADPAVTLYPVMDKKTGKIEQWDLGDWVDNIEAGKITLNVTQL